LNIAEPVCIIGGTGDLGFGLAMRLAAKGVEVIIGSRSRLKALSAAEELTASLGKNAHVRGDVNREAVVGCGLVVLSVPYEGAGEILSDVSSRLGEGCILVSCMIPFKGRPEGFESAAEWVRSTLGSNVHVVSALHTVSWEKLRKLHEPVDCDTFIFGDVPEAKNKVARLMSMIEGLRPIDGGPLRNSATGEKLAKLLVSVNKTYSISDAGIKVTGLGDEKARSRWGL